MTLHENEIYCGNSLALLNDIDDESIDLIITDPPFAIDFREKKSNYNRDSSKVIPGYVEIDKEHYREFMECWLSTAAWKLKPTGSMYLISGWTNLCDVLNAVNYARLHVQNHIIWKYQFGVFTKKRYVTSHYHILFLTPSTGGYTFNKIDHYPEDVWDIKRVYHPREMKTPNKLPEELVDKMILYSSNIGDLVLDPFAGSGVVLRRALALGREYIGIEIVPEYVEFAKEQIKGAIWK